MPKIVYLPLDERPCNYGYPQQLAAMTELKLVAPERPLLGWKKKPADTAALSRWLLKEAQDADYLIVSVDLLVYGGIVPSRLHGMPAEECLRRLAVLGEIKRSRPSVRIHAFNLIMRVPDNDTDEEEPDYYRLYGKAIFRYGYLTDKREREGLSDAEERELDHLQRQIPDGVLRDFIGRRRVNRQVNQHVIELAGQGVIDQLIIPLDDNALYGFSSREQQRLVCRVQELKLLDRVLVYPGADEIGCTMLANIFCRCKGYKPEIYVRYSSTQGPLIKPKYEDRSLNESVKAHLTAAGAVMADNSAETELILLVNSPAADQGQMAEQIPYAQRHRSYFSEIHYREFAEALQAYLRKGKRVALGDVAVCNGGDAVLMDLLKQQGLLASLTAYAGWNTSGNTLGTVIAHLIIASYGMKLGDAAERSAVLRASRTFYYGRLIEDFIYQSIVRQDMLVHDLPRLNAGYFNIGHCLEEAQRIAAAKISRCMEYYLPDAEEGRLVLSNIHFPWVRMFEIGFDLTIEPKTT
ncbi:hypothetical protein SK3146_02987 [Paenibacillus konkukensis]|uniref:DUF4127 family protein n=1 Tax=Paenibacillus konkukensis TaxID=2020716 RepID=A0ABY4RP61_9BACL|nr:DUF4127 family protein [Paenibacillus konkukensis]UQZ83780.1 hypothetical protein SK3146_02987 [Paenibacillus konkukensis]